MRALLAKIGNWRPRLDLSEEARRTFRFHMAYATLDAACGGILLNAPVVALKSLHAQNWQLQIREVYGGIGMLAALYLGSWMATRPKMPFVFIPGILAGLSTLVMSLVIGDAFWFLTFFGVGAMLEITTRPAISSILRMNYPVEQRGCATSIVRSWSSLSFVASNLLSAYLLQLAGENARTMAHAQILFAAILGLIGFVCFRRIRVQEAIEPVGRGVRLDIAKNLRDAAAVVFHNGRYRRYLFGCFLDGFCGMLYLPLIWVLLSNTLKFDYVWCAALMHALPAIVAFGTTAWLGPWFDRSNPWIAWAWVRFFWGADALLLAATPFVAGIVPPMIFVLPVLGRLLRGSVQGGWWVLWWQIGVTHFAPPGEDTSRYMGVMVFLNGMVRILAAAASMILLTTFHVRSETLFLVGGAGIILSGIYSLRQAARDRKELQPETIAQFESQFTKRDQR